jgi:probable HAF family extracellular repeat protein
VTTRCVLAVSAVLVIAGTTSLAGAEARDSARGWQIHALGALGGPGSIAVAVNEAGQAVGEADTPRRSYFGPYFHHAFLWQNGRTVDLGTLGGPESAALAINAAGRQVRWSECPTFPA